jgi:hypothetical protein
MKYTGWCVNDFAAGGLKVILSVRSSGAKWAESVHETIGRAQPRAP